MAHRPAGYSDDEQSDEDEFGFEISRSDTHNRYSHYDPPTWTNGDVHLDNQSVASSRAAGDSQPWQPICDDKSYNRQGRGSFQTAAVDLRLSVEAGDVGEVSRLICGHNLDMNQPLSVPGGWSPAVLAASSGHVGLLQWLLDKGAKLGTGPEMVTPLMAVCSSEVKDREDGLRDCAALLVQRGENVNASQRQRITALMLASKHGRIGLVRLLVDKGATKDFVDSQGWSALMFGVDAGYGDVARLLLESGADPDLLSSDGQRAADLAGSNSFPLIQDLVEHYSKERAVVLSRSEKTETCSDHNYNSVIKKFTELENVLYGLDLHEYLTAFNRHKVGLAEFLLLEESDLIDMGIDKVGARKKLMEGQAEIHKQYWEKPSMPQVGIEDKKMGLRLSCPDATGMMSNMSSHARYLKTSVEYIRRQLQNHGDRLLQVGGDLVSPNDLLQQTMSCETNLEPLLREVKYLRRQLQQAGAERKKAPVDLARKGGVGSDWRWVWQLGSGLVIAGAGVGVIFFRKLR